MTATHIPLLTAAAKKWSTLAVSAGPERRLRSGLFHSGAYTLPQQGLPIGCHRATLLPTGNAELKGWASPRLRITVASFELRFISPEAARYKAPRNTSGVHRIPLFIATADKVTSAMTSHCRPGSTNLTCTSLRHSMGRRTPEPAGRA